MSVHRHTCKHTHKGEHDFLQLVITRACRSTATHPQAKERTKKSSCAQVSRHVFFSALTVYRGLVKLFWSHVRLLWTHSYSGVSRYRPNTGAHQDYRFWYVERHTLCRVLTVHSLGNSLGTSGQINIGQSVCLPIPGEHSDTQVNCTLPPGQGNKLHQRQCCCSSCRCQPESCGVYCTRVIKHAKSSNVQLRPG